MLGYHKKKTNKTAFGLQGRRVTGQPTKGIYIKYGPKVVVK